MLSLILFSAVILCAEFSQGNPSPPHDEKYHSLVTDDALNRNPVQILIDAQAKLVNRLDQLEIQLKGEVAHRENLEADLSQKMIEMDTLKSTLLEQAEHIALLEKKAATNISHHPSSSVVQKAVTIPASCADIGMNPGSASGIHLVRETDGYANKIKTVFCDFSSPLPEIDISLGYIDTKREGKIAAGSYFFVQRNAEFSAVDAVVTFNLERLNIGGNGAPGDMDSGRGVFTVTIPGIYHFSFSGIKDSTTTPVNIYLRLNGFVITRAFAGSSSSASLVLHATLSLRKNDRVELFKEGTGSLIDTASNQYTSFIGFLLEAETAE